MQGSPRAAAAGGDVILLDADSHASIYAGVTLSGADIIRFKHNDPEDLAKRLRRLGEAVKLEVTKELSGEVLETIPEAEDVAMAKGLKQTNPAHRLTDRAIPVLPGPETFHSSADSEAGTGDPTADRRRALKKSRSNIEDSSLSKPGSTATW